MPEPGRALPLVAALLTSLLCPSCFLFRAKPPVYDPVMLPSGVIVQGSNTPLSVASWSSHVA